MSLEDRYRRAQEQGIVNLGGTVPALPSPSNEDERWAQLLDTLVSYLGSGAPSASPPANPLPGQVWVSDTLTPYRFTSGQWLSSLQRVTLSIGATAAAIRQPFLFMDGSILLKSWYVMAISTAPQTADNRWEFRLNKVANSGTVTQVATVGGTTTTTIYVSGVTPTPPTLIASDPLLEFRSVAVGSPADIVELASLITYQLVITV